MQSTASQESCCHPSSFLIHPLGESDAADAIASPANETQQSLEDRHRLLSLPVASSNFDLVPRSRFHRAGRALLSLPSRKRSPVCNRPSCRSCERSSRNLLAGPPPG